MTPHKVTPTWWDHATMWNAADPTLQDAGHTTDGGRVFGITRVRYDECDHYGCGPVAVVAYEDREQVERLLSLYADAKDAKGPGMYIGFTADSMQAALREFAAPTPPRPNEPQGLGAVVEDADGVRWVNVFEKGMWQDHRDRSQWREYREIAAVRVLSEGVIA